MTECVQVAGNYAEKDHGRAPLNDSNVRAEIDFAGLRLWRGAGAAGCFSKGLQKGGEGGGLCPRNWCPGFALLTLNY